MEDRKIVGNSAEKIAGKFLQNNGYEILEYNFRKPWGEIDIIAKKDGVFVFVEVKANFRYSDQAFDPEIRANRTKLKKIIKTAMLYMGKLGGNIEWQVDIVSVIFKDNGQKAILRHFKSVAESPF